MGGRSSRVVFPFVGIGVVSSIRLGVLIVLNTGHVV